MKFLLECVSCYGTPDESSKSAPPTPAHSRSPPSPSEASGLLLRRRRSGSLSRPGPADWKPSLHAISEDNAVAPPEPKPKPPPPLFTRAASERRSAATRPCAPSSTPRSYSRGHADTYYRRDHVPMIIPAFSPTPFMF